MNPAPLSIVAPDLPGFLSTTPPPPPSSSPSSLPSLQRRRKLRNDEKLIDRSSRSYDDDYDDDHDDDRCQKPLPTFFIPGINGTPRWLNKSIRIPRKPSKSLSPPRNTLARHHHHHHHHHPRSKTTTMKNSSNNNKDNEKRSRRKHKNSRSISPFRQYYSDGTMMGKAIDQKSHESLSKSVDSVRQMIRKYQ